MSLRELLSFGLTASLALGCESRLRCDVDELAGLVDELEQLRSEDARAIEGLSVACPRINRALLDALLQAYVFEAEFVHPQHPSAAETEAFARLRERVCAPATRAASADEDAQYASCDLQRYGLLEAGEPFVFEDAPAFALAEQLREAKVEPELARRLARALMSATLDGGRARQRCDSMPTSFACVEAARTRGIELPRSTCDIPALAAERIQISPSALEVDHGAVIPLERGRLPDAAVHDGLIPPMVEAFEAAYPEVFGRVDESRAQMQPLLIEADARTPYATLMGTLTTAEQLGFDRPSLVVTDGRGYRVLPISMPHSGAGRKLDEDEVAKIARLEVPPVGAMRFTASNSTQTIADLPALERAAEGSVGQTSRVQAVIVEAHDELPLAELVAVLDALRGPECRLGDIAEGEVIPDSCWLFGVVLASWREAAQQQR